MYIYGNGGIESDSTYVYKEDVVHEGILGSSSRRNVSNKIYRSIIFVDIYPCSHNRSNIAATANGYWRLRPRNETLLRDVVAAVGPVSAALYGSMETFYFYADGVYDDPACPIGTTHSVLIGLK